MKNSNHKIIKFHAIYGRLNSNLQVYDENLLRVVDSYGTYKLTYRKYDMTFIGEDTCITFIYTNFK